MYHCTLDIKSAGSLYYETPNQDFSSFHGAHSHILYIYSTQSKLSALTLNQLCFLLRVHLHLTSCVFTKSALTLNRLCFYSECIYT